jgi:hypothetical protein
MGVSFVCWIVRARTRRSPNLAADGLSEVDIVVERFGAHARDQRFEIEVGYSRFPLGFAHGALASMAFGHDG